MDAVRFKVGERPIVYVTAFDQARAFSRKLRGAGDTALADRIDASIARPTGQELVLKRGEGAESALAVLSATAGEGWHSITIGALLAALREYDA